MKYLIITYDEYINIPYIQNYEKCLQRSGNEFDVVIWNRSGHFSCDRPNFFVFEAKNEKSKFSKIIPFLRWRKFVLEILQEHDYDRLIVLTTIPAVLLADRLLSKYAGRYWLDIRDYTYEGVPLYRRIVGRLARSAGVTSISSAAFVSFLPENAPIVLTHNITNDTEEHQACNLNTEKDCFSIAFVGGVRYPEQNQQLLRQLANNSKYTLKYIGKTHPGCDLRPFCQSNGIRNVEFLPPYKNEQKPEIYQSIDLINSIYGNDSKVVTLALPNKLYDCVLFKKPIIVSAGTFLTELVEEYHLGLAVDVNSDPIARKLDGYLASFDRDEFETGCARFLQRVREENRQFEKALDCFCSGGDSERKCIAEEYEVAADAK